MIKILINKNPLHPGLWLGLIIAIAACTGNAKKEEATAGAYVAVAADYQEQHRLQFHFSPKEMWMNDPNGMVYFDGEYHLFYQYYPDSNVWGPMHWGHAVSEDLVHWEHLPISLYPDDLGYIFSGSAVADLENTSGFGSEQNPPLVAVYTYHDPEGESKGEADYQTQGIAYSLDKGRTWTRHEKNPVLGNPGIKDFRDPKVFRNEATSRWIMILAVKDRVHLYSSANLIEWQKESEFGVDAGAHGGVWECPDLFTLSVEGEEKWVMLVSINPGGPNGGSATQYFIGDFDGHKFTAEHSDIRWLDYGPDNYAGVTWSNVEGRKLFVGWMSNWLYGQVVPTEKWRSAMTVPRELGLVKIDGQTYVTSKPVNELEDLREGQKPTADLALNSSIDLGKTYDIQSSKFDLSFTIENKPFEIKLSNEKGEYLLVGYEAGNGEFYIDRTQSGKTEFSDAFGKRNTAKRIANDDHIEFRLLADVGSVELFADDGEVVMTSLFFPNGDFTHLEISTKEKVAIKDFQVSRMKSIWSAENP